MKNRPVVVLGATLTADGKLDTTSSPMVLVEFFASQSGDVLLSNNPPMPLAGPWRQVRVDEHEDLAERLHGLRTQNKTPRVICVGEPALFRRLLDGHLVDELYLLVRPKIDGRRKRGHAQRRSGRFFSGVDPVASC